MAADDLDDGPAGVAPSTVAASTDEDFAALLLQALTSMALRSKRRQADVMAALRGAGLRAEPARLRAALRLLHTQGCIENLVPLSDGGLLLSVRQAALARLAPAPQWLPLDVLDEG
jgi:hypothetical protein